jgi:hypothetical protein
MVHTAITLCLFQSNKLQIASDKYWYKQQTMKNIDHKRKTKLLQKHKILKKQTYWAVYI